LVVIGNRQTLSFADGISFESHPRQRFVASPNKFSGRYGRNRTPLARKAARKVSGLPEIKKPPNGADTRGRFIKTSGRPIYRFMTDRDLNAVYEFLSAIPPASPGECTGAGQSLPPHNKKPSNRAFLYTTLRALAGSDLPRQHPPLTGQPGGSVCEWISRSQEHLRTQRIVDTAQHHEETAQISRLDGGQTMRQSPQDSMARRRLSRISCRM